MMRTVHSIAGSVAIAAAALPAQAAQSLEAPPPSAVRPPRPLVPIHRLFSNGDYPAEAVKARLGGNVRFRLMVSKDGRVTHCVVTGSSRSPVLDSTTCRIVRARARFTPSLDAMGQAAPGAFSGVIAWRLPSVPRSPPSPRP